MPTTYMEDGVIHRRFTDQNGLVRDVRIDTKNLDDPECTYHRLYHPDGSEIPVPGYAEINGCVYLFSPPWGTKEITPELPDSKKKVYKVQNMRQSPGIMAFEYGDTSSVTHVKTLTGCEFEIPHHSEGWNTVIRNETEELLVGRRDS